ncbi:hypothetical protein Scep_005368 [Stephania cephalantha]|uniref:Aminotransferase-like plant mobile domain-containing protein n=1 Tax=Stephania cephalantha TaxID=152367 RepID=A0AAP0KVS8_9MAGN
MLISAFMERWQQETNTFHLPFGEMSITLEDMRMLLKIPVMGKVVECDTIEQSEAVELVCSALDVFGEGNRATNKQGLES